MSTVYTKKKNINIYFTVLTFYRLFFKNIIKTHIWLLYSMNNNNPSANYYNRYI